MDLHRLAREYYALQITTAPTLPASAWEASFDDGATWDPATVITDAEGDWSAWLVAGAAAAAGAAVAVIDRDMTPVIRATDNPEIIAREAKVIRYVK